MIGRVRPLPSILLIHRFQALLIVGVDTHKHAHVAVALDQVGAVIATITIPVDRTGYAQLEAWSGELGEQAEFGIEGTGSYGAGLASFLRRRGHQVLEVNRPDRRIRYLRGKNDTIDAETAARAVLTGAVTAVPKTADGTVEMIRQIKIAKDTAVKSRSQAIITLKTIIVNAAPELREIPRRAQRQSAPRPMPRITLRVDGQSRRRGPLHAPHARAAPSRPRSRGPAPRTGPGQSHRPRRTSTHQPVRYRRGLGRRVAPGRGGDNPERIRSEAALAKSAAPAPSLPRPGKRPGTASTVAAIDRPTPHCIES